jgi:hypothetical protein
MFLTSNPTSARHVHVQQAATFIAYKPTTPAVCHNLQQGSSTVEKSRVSAPVRAKGCGRMVSLTTDTPMAVDLMTRFHDAQRYGANVQTCAASDTFKGGYFDAAKNSFVRRIVPLDTGRGSHDEGDQHEKHAGFLLPNQEEHEAQYSTRGRIISPAEAANRLAHAYLMAMDAAKYTFENVEPTPSQNAVPVSGVCTILPADAITIFVAKKQAGKQRDQHLAKRLAQDHGITSKAIRDIWNLRTWSQITRPHWTDLDTARFARKKLSKIKEVTVEPMSSQDAVPASDVAGYNVQILQDKQEDLMLPEHDDSQGAVDETRAPSTVFAGPPTLFDDSAWLVDSAIIAKEFNEIFLAWHHCMDI